MRKLFKFKYPKIAILVLLIIIAYFIFKEPQVVNFFNSLGNLRYFGIFLAGMMIAFGFSAPFAVGFFIALNPSNLLLAGLVGGAGALVADLLIFNLIRFSFEDEFLELENTKTAKKMGKFIGKEFGGTIRRYLMYVFAGILIATPLPDEAGVIMLAGLTKIRQRVLGIVSFLLHTLFIVFLLLM